MSFRNSIGVDFEKTESGTLEKTKKICLYCSRLMKFIFSLICIWSVVSLAAMLCLLAGFEFFENSYAVTPVMVLVYLPYALSVLIICWILVRMISDTAKGQTPFTTLQVRRMRLVSICLLVYAVFGALLAGVDTLILESSVDKSWGMDVLSIDFAPLVASAVIYAFSFVFEYGVLLQEFSDETL